MTAPGRRARILIVEDEPVLAELIVENLDSEGYEAVAVSDGIRAAREWQRWRPDLVVLDVMLPGENGFDLCSRMRRAGDQTPVLFLSARGDPNDRVRGLKVGGDDYLPKPFHLPEFLLRISNLLRRKGWGAEEAPETISVGPHSVDLRSWTALLDDGRRETLGERELGILRLLASRPGEVVRRQEILDSVWGEDAFPSSRTVDNYVMRLRKIFEEDSASPRYFHTVWGAGYRFTPDGEGAGG